MKLWNITKINIRVILIYVCLIFLSATTMSCSSEIKAGLSSAYLPENREIIDTFLVHDIKVEKGNLAIELTEISLLTSKATRWYNTKNDVLINNEIVDHSGYEFIIIINLTTINEGVYVDYSSKDNQVVINNSVFYGDDDNDLGIITKATFYETRKIDDYTFELTGECYIPNEIIDIENISKVDIVLGFPDEQEIYLPKLNLEIAQ